MAATARVYVTRQRRRESNDCGAGAGDDCLAAPIGNAALSAADYWASERAQRTWGVVEVDRGPGGGGRRKFCVTVLIWGFETREEALLYAAIVTRVQAAYEGVKVANLARCLVPFGAPPATVEAFGVTLPVEGVVCCHPQTMREAMTLFEEAYVEDVLEESRRALEKLRARHRKIEKAAGERAGRVAHAHAATEDLIMQRARENLNDDRMALRTLQTRIHTAAANLPAAFFGQQRKGHFVVPRAGSNRGNMNSDSNDSDDSDDDVSAELGSESEAEEAEEIEKEELEDARQAELEAAAEAAEAAADAAAKVAAKLAAAVDGDGDEIASMMVVDAQEAEDDDEDEDEDEDEEDEDDPMMFTD